jgi:transcriptional regulator with XRE-family HTH domain
MTMLDNRTWTLAERLKKARQLAGMEQAQLAEAVGVSRVSISNYELGKTEPTVTTFVLWAEATGATLEWLAEGVVRPEGFEPPTY